MVIYSLNYLAKELYHLEKAHPSVITLLIANVVWTILIQQIYTDFHGWENHTCTNKLLLNFIQIKCTDTLNPKKL